MKKKTVPVLLAVLAAGSDCYTHQPDQPRCRKIHSVG